MIWRIFWGVMAVIWIGEWIAVMFFDFTVDIKATAGTAVLAASMASWALAISWK